MKSWLSNILPNSSSSSGQHTRLSDASMHPSASHPDIMLEHHPSPSPAPPPTPTMGRWLYSLKVPPKKHKSPMLKRVTEERRVSSPQLLDTGTTNVLQTAMGMAASSEEFENVDPDMAEIPEEPLDPEAPPEPVSKLGAAASSSQQELVDVFKDKAAEERPEKMGKEQFFARVDFLLALCEALHKYGLPTHRIEFQISEAAREELPPCFY